MYIICQESIGYSGRKTDATLTNLNNLLRTCKCPSWLKRECDQFTVCTLQNYNDIHSTHVVYLVDNYTCAIRHATLRMRMGPRTHMAHPPTVEPAPTG